MTRKILWLLALSGLAGGCVGDIAPGTGSGGTAAPNGSPSGSTGTPPGQMSNQPGGPPNNPNNPNNPNPGNTTKPDPNAAGLMPLTRLTRREYNNTVRDLLGDTSNPADAFPEDHDGDFLFRRAGLVSSQDATTLRDAAEAVAGKAVKDLAKLVTCDTSAANEQTCVRSFVQSFGLRAYRRPPTSADVDRLLALYQTGRTTLMLPVADSVGLVLEAMLQSTAFLYHWELGSDKPTIEGGLAKLGPYETASRLSYFLWGSMPDQALFDAAAAGKLSTQAEVETQAKRMLGNDKARETIAAFVEEWLELDQVPDRPKDPMIYPEFKDDLKTAMGAETRAFVDNVLFDGDGKLSTLLTANHSFVSQPAAAIYGIAGVTGTATKRTDLDPKERAGLLTQLGFLTLTGASDGSNPVKRGRKVYERVLCGVLPTPPANVPPPKPASAGGTTRDRFKEHDENACTAGCHSLMDPIGFAFEHYDGIGRYRTLDNQLPVDSSGAIELDGAKKSFADATALAKILAESQEARRCFATQWARFALKRNNTDADRAMIDAVVNMGGTGGAGVRDILAGLAGARAFRYRALAAGEMKP